MAMKMWRKGHIPFELATLSIVVDWFCLFNCLERVIFSPICCQWHVKFIEIFFFHPFEDLEYMCHRRGLGFTVILTAPGETVITMRNSFRVSVLEDIRIAIKPKYITTSDGLRSYEPNKRQCFFSGERKLHFFKIYSKNHCESECLSNFTKNYCGCVKFSMPSMCLIWKFLQFFYQFSKKFEIQNLNPMIWSLNLFRSYFYYVQETSKRKFAEHPK